MQPTSEPDRPDVFEYLALTLGLATLPMVWFFGGTSAWGTGLLRVVGLMSAVLLLVALGIDRNARRRVCARRAVFYWIAFLLVAAVALLVRVSPASEPSGLSLFLPVSAAGAAGATAVWNWGAVLSIGSMLCLFMRPRSARILLGCVVLNAGAVCLVGAWFRIQGAERVLGLLKPDNQSFFGPFLYHNHFVAFALLALCAAVGLAVVTGSARSRVVRVLARCVFGGCAVAIVFSIPLVRSRTGWMLLLPTLLLLAAIIWAHARVRLADAPVRWRRFRGAMVLAGALVVIAACIGLYLGRDQVRIRWQDTLRQMQLVERGKAPDLRFYVWRDMLRSALDRPVFGWGLGSFHALYPVYAGAEFYEDAYQPETKLYGTLVQLENAHQDWIQLFAETGAVGLLLFGAGLISASGLFREGAGIGTSVRPFVLSGALVFALVACLDSPMQNPAARLGFVMMVVLAGAANTERKPKEERS